MKKNERSDDILFLQRLTEIAGRCCERYAPEFTHFLDGRELRMAKEHLRSFKNDIIFVEYGGFENAERCKIGVFPKDVYGYDGFVEEELYEMFEMSAVVICGSGFSSFSHRDVLGSVLALGIKRETLGDIFVEEDGKKAYICLDEVQAKYLCDSLEFVSRDKVKVSMADVKSLPVLQKKFSVISGTVASERLDCVISLVTNVSREKAKVMISSGLVNVNHFEETRCDVDLSEEDILSVRGYGRFVIKEFGSLTRKGRNRVVVHKMI